LVFAFLDVLTFIPESCKDCTQKSIWIREPDRLYSAKRGIAIACRVSVCLSVCPSVCDVGGSRPHRLKILETNCMNNSPNIFTLCNPKVIHLLPGEHGEILGRLEVGWEKVACWSTKAAISLKRVKIEEKLLWRAYRKSSMLFRFFGSLPYFYFRFRLYGHRDGRFCLILARTAQQSVLDGTKLSGSKLCAYCRIVRSE